MSLSLGLLGLLTYEDSTGYDLAKVFDDSLNNFWHAQSSQIYRELKRMEDAGWVSSQHVIQEGRPNKRIYSITDAGRDELAKWLTDGNSPSENPHQAILLRVFFGAEAPEATLALLRDFRDRCQAAFDANCAGIRRNIDSYATLVDDGQAKSKYWEMTLDFGMAMNRAMAEWANTCIAKIEQEVSK